MIQGAAPRSIRPIAIAAISAMLFVLFAVTASAAAMTIQATAGQQFSGPVGTGAESCPLDPDTARPGQPAQRNCQLVGAGPLTGTINWGDGISSDATVTRSCPQTLGSPSCTITVSGQHIYTVGGSYSGSFSWSDGDPTAPASGTGSFTATVSGSGTCPSAQPVAVTGSASNVTDTTATLSGAVNPCGASTSGHFEYGLTTSYGKATPAQALGSGTIAQAVSASLTGLTPGATYHYRVVAQSGATTINGSDQTFTTRLYLPPSTSGRPTVTDAGGAPVTQATIGSMLRCVAPTFTADPGDVISLAYLWRRDGVAIDGATGQAYTLTYDDERTATTCEVNATDRAGTASTDSAAVTGYECYYPDITSFDPTSGHGPQGAEGGTIVHLHGRFFCPGDTVTIGDSNPITPISISADGTDIELQIPLDAPYGDFRIGGSWSRDEFSADEFRWVDGFSFHNFGEAPTFQNVVDGFGPERAYTGRNCGFPFCFPGMPDLTFVQFAAWVSNWVGTGGNCWGFSLAANRFLLGQRQRSDFPDSEHAGKTWTLDSFTGPSAPLRDFIKSQQTTDASVEWQQQTNSQTGIEAGMSDTAATQYLLDRINGVLRANRYPIVSLFTQDSAGNTIGHAVVAYATEGTANNAYIDVYDSNLPGQQGVGRDQLVSRIHIQPGYCIPQVDCTPTLWQLPSSNMFGTKINQITALDPLTIPVHPTPDWGLSGVKAGSLGTVIAAGGDTGGALERFVQVTDGRGRTLLDGQGRPRYGQAGSLPGTLIASPSAGAKPSAPMVLLPQGVGPVTVKLADTGGGQVQQAVFTRSVSGLVSTDGGAGGSQTVRASGSEVSAASSLAGRPLTIALTRPMDGGSVLATLQTTTAPGSTSALTLGSGGVDLTHSGAPVNATLTLSAPGSAAREASLRLAPGKTQVTGIRWRALEGSKLRARHAGREVGLRGRPVPAGAAGVAAVRIIRSHGHARIVIVRARRTLPSGSRVSFSWQVSTGGRIRARHTTLVAAPARTAAFSLPIARGHAYLVTSTITAIALDHGHALSEQGQRTVRLRG